MKRYINNDYENAKTFHEVIKQTSKFKEGMEIPVKTTGTFEIPTQRVLDKYNTSKFFDLSDEVILSLDKTNYSGADQELLKMPFESILLDVNQEFEGQMFAEETIEARIGEDYSQHYHTDHKPYIVESVLCFTVNEELGEGETGLENPIALMALIRDKETGQHRDIYQITGIGDEDWDEPETVEQYIANLVNNFLLFLNQPEVNYRVNERSEKNRRKRKKKNKTPLPDDGIVEVSGEIERYLGKLQETDIEHTYRYWVRGHWRTLRDEDHWGDNAGERVWVKPHIRGEGVLVDKDYKVKED